MGAICVLLLLVEGGSRSEAIVYSPDPRWGFGNRQPLWPCLAGVFGWFDSFGGRGGRSALYIFAAEHGLRDHGLDGVAWGLDGGGLEDPQLGAVFYGNLVGVCPQPKTITPDGDYEPRPSLILLCHPRPVPIA